MASSSSRLASQTLHGQYHMVTMPDGQQVLMSKLENGKWAATEERLKEEKEKDDAFNKRFAGTDTYPADFVKRDTDTLTPDLEKMKQNANSPSKRLDAYLGEMLGNPDDLIAGKIPLPKIKEKRIEEHIIGLITVFNNPKWNKVKEMLWK